MKFSPLLAVLCVAVAVSCGQKPPVSPLGPETCDNAKDDNGDGKTDCADPKCFSSPMCAASLERCDNGVDDDGNGQTDCLDPACEGKECGVGCMCGNGTKQEIACADRDDNDGDNLVDCNDPDCRSTSACSAAGGGSGGGGSGGGGSGGGGSGGGGSGGGGSGGGGSGGGGSAGGGSGGGGSAGGGGSTGGGSTGGGSTGGGSAGGGSTGGGSTGGGSTGGGSAGGGSTGGGSAGGGSTGGGSAGGGSTGGGSAGGGGSTGGGTGSSENCGDGIDNDGDRAIDCADSNCAGNVACTNLPDGAGCASSGQCAGGQCLTESTFGFPNGYCTNVGACTVGTNAGCHGGLCVAGATNLCRARCTGSGLGASGRCRQGYACNDLDSNASNNNNICVSLCTQDSDCAGAGPGYGCNPWSKYCESKDFGLGKYGAPCTSSSQCEGGLCLTGADFPKGYCAGTCRADASNCASGGYCYWYSGWADNVGFCFEGCSTVFATCRSEATFDYTCWNDTNGANGGKYCYCLTSGDPCILNKHCCSGVCDPNFAICN